MASELDVMIHDFCGPTFTPGSVTRSQEVQSVPPTFSNRKDHILTSTGEKVLPSPPVPSVETEPPLPSGLMSQSSGEDVNFVTMDEVEVSREDKRTLVDEPDICQLICQLQ